MPSNHLPPRRQSYAKRLVALSLFVTIGFCASLGFVLWEIHDRDREKARQTAATVIASISSDIARNLELYDLSMQAVVDGVKLPGLSRLTPEMRQLLLFDRSATAKNLGSIFVLDRNGIVTIDSRTLTPRADNHSQKDYFRVQAQNPNAGSYLSQPWLAPDGEYLIAISRRLSNDDGSFAGAVVGTMRLGYFHDMFRNLKLGDQDSLSLVRENGTLIMRTPYQAASIGRDLSASPIFQRVSAYPSGSFEDTGKLDGVDRLFVYRQVGEHPLILTYGLSLDAIHAGWRNKSWLIGSLMLALCAINIALVVFLTRALKQRGEAEHQLSIMATVDSLTGLCNRRRLDELFDIEWRRAQREQSPVALLMIDADHFKTYNDQFGHQAGDAALAAIANCIEGNTRRPADVCARYGGEEFAVLLPGSSITGAVEFAEKIHSSLRALRADQQGRPDSTPTVSIGAASMIPRQGLQLRDLIKAADTALYEAKSKGRDRTEPEIRRIEARQRLVAA